MKAHTEKKNITYILAFKVLLSQSNYDSFYLNKFLLTCIWDPNYFHSPLDAKKVFLPVTFVYSK